MEFVKFQQHAKCSYLIPPSLSQGGDKSMQSAEFLEAILRIAVARCKRELGDPVKCLNFILHEHSILKLASRVVSSLALFVFN
jgi:hypothetical protein